MVGGSVVYYAHLLSQCPPDSLVVVTQTHEDAAAFDASAPYPVVRSWTVPYYGGYHSRLRKLAATLALGPMLLYWLLRHRIAVLHLGDLLPHILVAWPIARLTGRRLTISVMGEELTTRSDPFRNVFGPFRALCDITARWMLRRCDLVQTISDYTKAELLRRGVPADRMAVITPGIDLEKAHCDGSIDAEIAARLAGKRVLLTVGRFMRRKGQDMTIRALPRIVSEHPDAVYVMAGAGRPEECDEYLRLIESLDLQDRVLLLRNLDNSSIAWLYDRCDVFVMANRTLPNGDTEGYGIVFLEAGTWGKPVVGGRAGGAVEAVEDGVTGILVDGTSEEDIVGAIGRLLSGRDLAKRMGEAGRRKAAENSWDSKCETYRNLIETLAQPSKRSRGIQPSS
jgi:glycosyltransferase involved in cell wall biosynthesis